MKWMAIRVVSLAFCVLQLAAEPENDLSFFAARREALMKQIEGSVAVLQGAADTRAYERFRQSNDFYYLSGVEAPGAFILIDAVQHRSVLFLPPRNRFLEAWEGPRMFAGEDARQATGFDEVLEASQLGEELEKRKTSLRHVYTPLMPEETTATSRDRALQFDRAQERSEWDGRPSRERAFAASLKRKLGESVETRDLSPILDRMRRVKDAQEIGRMREAGRMGALGMAEAIRAARPGDFEYQIGAVAEFFFKWHGAQSHAYFPIVGSGPNSCFMHYSAGSRRTEVGDIVVMDFGPDYRYYHADISRTFPVSGRFTEEQAKIYQIVLEAQKAALARVRPGAALQDLGKGAREVVDRYGYGKNWRHGVSHYVGMSTHDVGGVEPLVPGVVLTIEPGLYFPGKNLGVRIEDTVLVTADGCEVLTKDVPKELFEIEQLRSEGSRSSIRLK